MGRVGDYDRLVPVRRCVALNPLTIVSGTPDPRDLDIFANRWCVFTVTVQGPASCGWGSAYDEDAGARIEL
jgi:hypothetical protein